MSIPLIGAGHPDWAPESDQGAQYQVVAPTSPVIAAGASQSFPVTAAQLFDLNIVYASVQPLIELVVYQNDPLGVSVQVAATLSTIDNESLRVPFRSLGGDAQIVLANRDVAPRQPSLAVYGSVGGLPEAVAPYQGPYTAFAAALPATALVSRSLPGSGLLDRIGWSAWCSGQAFTVQATVYVHHFADYRTMAVPLATSAGGAPMSGDFATSGLGVVLTLTNNGAAAADAMLAARGFRYT